MGATSHVMSSGWGFAPVLYCIGASTLVTAIFVRLTLSRLLAPLEHLPVDAHWSKRARFTRAVRDTLMFGLFLLPASLGALTHHLVGPQSIVPPLLLGVVVVACSGLVVLGLETRRSAAIYGTSRTFGCILRDHMARAVLLSPHLFVALALIPTARPEFGISTAIGVGMAVVMALAISAGGSLPPGRLIGHVEAAPPRVHELVSRVAVAQGVRVRGIWVARWSVANAFAFPLGRQLVFTQPLIDRFDDAELEVVCAHELDHFDEPLVARILHPVAIALLMANIPLGVPLQARFGSLAMVGLVAATFASIVGLRRLMQRLEEHADEVAHDLETDVGAYARVLEKLYRINENPAVARGSTHPSLYDRMQSAGVEPDFPRPAPPPPNLWGWLGLGTAVVCYGVLLLVPKVTPGTGAIPALVGGRAVVVDAPLSSWTEWVGRG